jgi:general secretion pathway protein K
VRAPDPGIRRGQERGAALLTVLMLVAIIAVMAGAALEKLRLSTRLASNAATGEQARAYALAAETMALTRVSNLLAPRPKQVTLAERLEQYAVRPAGPRWLRDRARP